MFKAKVSAKYHIVVANSYSELIKRIDKEVSGPNFERFFDLMKKDYDEKIIVENCGVSKKDYDEAPDKTAFIKEYLIKEYIPKRLSFLSEVMQKVVSWKSNQLVVYRRLDLQNQDTFLKNLKNKTNKPLGIYWAWNPEPMDVDVDGGDGDSIVLVGTVAMSGIDFLKTSYANMNVFGSNDENEITLKKGAPVKIIDVLDDYGGESLWDHGPLSLVAVA